MQQTVIFRAGRHELVIPARPGAKTAPLVGEAVVECLLPGGQDPYGFGWREPGFYLAALRRWQQQGTALRVIEAAAERRVRVTAVRCWPADGGGDIRAAVTLTPLEEGAGGVRR